MLISALKEECSERSREKSGSSEGEFPYVLSCLIMEQSGGRFRYSCRLLERESSGDWRWRMWVALVY